MTSPAIDHGSTKMSMSKPATTRRRAVVRSQSADQTERYARVATWIDDPDPFRDTTSSADLLGRRAAEAWLRIIGLA